MKMIGLIILTLLGLLPGCFSSETLSRSASYSAEPYLIIKLPEPALKGAISVEEALAGRRSIREYSALALALADVSQLLWAAQGQTADWGGRTAPSAGGIYPLEVYLVVGSVENLSPGVYRYIPAGHGIIKIKEGDFREDLSGAALDQEYIKEGAIDIVITAVYGKIIGKYGTRGVRYADMEAGHAAQNICLQGTALNLGLVTVGAFSDDRIREVISLSADEVPLYVIPVGIVR